MQITVEIPNERIQELVDGALKSISSEDISDIIKTQAIEQLKSSDIVSQLFTEKKTVSTGYWNSKTTIEPSELLKNIISNMIGTQDQTKKIAEYVDKELTEHWHDVLISAVIQLMKDGLQDDKDVLFTALNSRIDDIEINLRSRQLL